MNTTLVKGLELLELLSRNNGPMTVTEVADRLGIAKSHAHRLLQTLIQQRYASQDQTTSAYSVSLKLWELGAAISSKISIRNLAAPWMERLLQSTRETVHLSILDVHEVVYLHKLDSLEPVRSYAEVGGRAPAYCVATGKAILAWESPSLIAAIASNLTPHTPHTIHERDAFLRELEKVRANGYAVNRGEWRESVRGIASAIRDGSGKPLAAIGISGPAARFRSGQIKELAQYVVAAAANLSRAVDEQSSGSR